jgi:hypothetical protein
MGGGGGACMGWEQGETEVRIQRKDAKTAPWGRSAAGG